MVYNMKKQELELENKFLKLQLLKIHKIISDEKLLNDRDVLLKNIGRIMAISEKEFYEDSLKFIKEYGLDYNFYDKELNL